MAGTRCSARGTQRQPLQELRHQRFLSDGLSDGRDGGTGSSGYANYVITDAKHRKLFMT